MSNNILEFRFKVMNGLGLRRSLFIVAKSHECNEVLDPFYTPGSEPEQRELFEAKQTL